MRIGFALSAPNNIEAYRIGFVSTLYKYKNRWKIKGTASLTVAVR
jgi:hypothetical protein